MMSVQSRGSRVTGRVVRWVEVVRIARPCSETWSFITDFDNAARWMGGMDRSQRLDTGEPGRGSRLLLSKGNRKRQAVITYWKADEGYSLSRWIDGLEAIYTYSVSPTDQGTVLALRVESFVNEGWGRLAPSVLTVMGWFTRFRDRSQISRAKYLLESRDSRIPEPAVTIAPNREPATPAAPEAVYESVFKVPKDTGTPENAGEDKGVPESVKSGMSVPESNVGVSEAPPEAPDTGIMSVPEPPPGNHECLGTADGCPETSPETAETGKAESPVKDAGHIIQNSRPDANAPEQEQKQQHEQNKEQDQEPEQERDTRTQTKISEHDVKNDRTNESKDTESKPGPNENV